MNDVLRERLNTLYAAVKLGQLDFVLNSIDDDIEYISYFADQGVSFSWTSSRQGGDVGSVARRSPRI
jgi:hypothetical protein